MLWLLQALIFATTLQLDNVIFYKALSGLQWAKYYLNFHFYLRYIKYLKVKNVFISLLQNQEPGAEEAFKVLGHAFEMIGEPVS